MGDPDSAYCARWRERVRSVRISNAYGEDLTLRIAPELYSQRLVVGGSGPVYELGRFPQ